MQKALQDIKLLALDVDGVMTDGCINIGEEGELFKAFNAKDGLGISAAIRCGIKVAIITGRRSKIIHNRAAELGVTMVSEGIKDKYTELLRLQQQLGLDKKEVAYIGDDLNDLPAFRAVGIAFAPIDACEEARAEAFVLSHAGGRGAVRETVEMILKAQGKWAGLVDDYKNIKAVCDAQ